MLGLVNHIFKHEVKGEFQLRLYTDIYLLIKKHEGKIFDGDLLADAEQAGISGGLRTVLTILNKYYGIDIPPEYVAREGTEQDMVVAFRDKLPDPGEAKTRSEKDLFLENFRSLKGIRHKLIFLTGDIFPSIEFMKSRYGCSTLLSAILHYPHRLWKNFMGD